MGQALPQTPIETPATPQAPGTTPGGAPAQPPTPANDNHPPAANDNNPRSNAPGRIRRIAGAVARRGALAWEGAKLVGRVLFDPAVFGDNSAYFADTPAGDATERAMIRQGEIDIKQNGMDPTMVRSRVRKALEEKRQKEREEKDRQARAEHAENVRIHGECKVLAMAIYAKAAEVQGRFEALRVDKLDLFNKAPTAPNPSLPVGSGSWKGHVEQLEGQQTNLRSRIAAYDEAKCRQPHIPQAIRDMSKAPPPTRPGGPPAYPFTALPQ